MPSDLLAALITQRDYLNTTISELEVELSHLNFLIAKYEGSPAKTELRQMPMPRLLLKPQPKRVRGVLAAARKAIEQISGPFDKNQLLAKLVEMDEEFAHKKITGSNIRNALRLLTQDGVIKVESEATATSCARYVKAA
jgi:hypothetical protein